MSTEYRDALEAVRAMIDESPCDDDCFVSGCPRIAASSALPTLERAVAEVERLRAELARVEGERDAAMQIEFCPRCAAGGVP